MTTAEAVSAVSAVTWLLSYTLRRGRGTEVLWQSVPDKWRWLMPLGISAALTGLEAYQSGRPWSQSAWVGFFAFLASVGAHRTASDAPGPYNAKPKATP